MSRLRSLHLLKTSVGATWALRQISELVRLGEVVHVALPPGGPMVGKYAAAGAIEHLVQTDFPVRQPWTFGRVKSRLVRLIEEARPDIVHSHFVGTTISLRLALGKASSLPRVFQVPGPLHLEHVFFRIAEMALAGRADYWIGSCGWTCRKYADSGIDPSRVFLSYYGTDLDVYKPHRPGKLRAELGVPNAVRLVGMVAHMYAPKRYLGQKRGLKGHEDLIDAFAICLSQRADLLCVIVGGPWNAAAAYEQDLRRYARSRCGDRVIFLGPRQDIPAIYADLDVAVHPSHSENVGGAVESCLLAVPTVCTDVGGFPDLIKDGSTGWLTPAKNPRALSQAILECLSDRPEAARRASAGQRLATNLFDQTRTAAEIKNIHEKIVARNSR